MPTGFRWLIVAARLRRSDSSSERSRFKSQLPEQLPLQRRVCLGHQRAVRISHQRRIQRTVRH